MVRKVVGRGPGSGAADVLTFQELEALKEITQAGGIDRPYQLVDEGFDSSSAYIIVEKLIDKKFLERDVMGRIKPTAKTSELDQVIVVKNKPSIFPISGPTRITKLGGGQVEMIETSGLSSRTNVVLPGTYSWIEPSKDVPSSLTLRIRTGSWGVVLMDRMKANPRRGIWANWPPMSSSGTHSVE